MKIYEVKVIETLAEWVPVEAESEEKAIDIVEEMHRNGGVCVGDIDSTDYEVANVVDVDGITFFIYDQNGQNKREMRTNEIWEYLRCDQVAERIKTKREHPDEEVSCSVRDKLIVFEMGVQEYTVEVINKVTIKAKSAQEAGVKAAEFGFDVVSVKNKEDRTNEKRSA